MDNARRHPASKIPVPAEVHPPSRGATSSQPGKAKLAALDKEVPDSELEKLEYLRSKLEQSVDELIKVMKELDEILSPEGSSEQERSLTDSPAELRAELQRHRELTARVEALRKENKHPRNHKQGFYQRGISAVDS